MSLFGFLFFNDSFYSFFISYNDRRCGLEEELIGRSCPGKGVEAAVEGQKWQGKGVDWRGEYTPRQETGALVINEIARGSPQKCPKTCPFKKGWWPFKRCIFACIFSPFSKKKFFFGTVEKQRVGNDLERGLRGGIVRIGGWKRVERQRGKKISDLSLLHWKEIEAKTAVSLSKTTI